MNSTRPDRDGQLFDLLATGAEVRDDDRVALMLAAWRDDLRAGVLAEPTDRFGGAATAAPLPPADAASAGDGATVVPISAARPRPPRLTRYLLATAAGLIMIAGILIAAANAGPSSPLWPVTQVVYQDRAQSRADQAAAERTIAQARRALTDHRYADAARLLDEADKIITRMHDRRAAQELRTQVAHLRQLLLATTTTADRTPKTPPLPPATTTAPGGPNPTPAGAPAPTGTGRAVPGLPSLSPPGLPVPSLPLPSLPLG